MVRQTRGFQSVEFHAGDALKANGKVLPVCCHHVLKWPLTTKLAFDKTQGPCSVANHAGHFTNAVRILLPVWFHHLGKWSAMVIFEPPHAHGRSVPASVQKIAIKQIILLLGADTYVRVVRQSIFSPVAIQA